MINARVSYLEKNVGFPNAFRALYIEMGKAKIGITNCPGDGEYFITPETRYDELISAIRRENGKSTEVDAGKVVPVFLAAKRNKEIGEQVEALFELLNHPEAHN